MAYEQKVSKGKATGRRPHLHDCHGLEDLLEVEKLIGHLVFEGEDLFIMTKMTPPVKDLLRRLTQILKNRHNKVQEQNCRQRYSDSTYCVFSFKNPPHLRS